MRELVDTQVGGLNRLLERWLDAGVIGRRVILLAQSRHGRGTSDLTGSVAAESVGDHVEVSLALQRERVRRREAANAVFVRLPMGARLREPARFELEHA